MTVLALKSVKAVKLRYANSIVAELLCNVQRGGRVKRIHRSRWVSRNHRARNAAPLSVKSISVKSLSSSGSCCGLKPLSDPSR